jgi:GDP-4-dehydro-6-deoxy-D-mannose reductase
MISVGRPMRVLVMGANGFVGPHLCRLLEDSGDEVVPVGGPGAETMIGAVPIDVRDAWAVADAISRAHPDAIVNLAGISSVAQSHENPSAALEVNVLGTLNVCIAVRASKRPIRLLYVSSGEVYGAVPGDQPATEATPLAPSSPYAASKVAAETVCFQFARSYGLHIVCARPFNHLGAGQAPAFAIPSFARQLEQAREAGGTAALSVGNLAHVRDFSHVRDVVAAYGLLLGQGVSGEVYNICSEQGRSMRSILDELVDLAGVRADVHVDEAKLRPVDIPFLVGSSLRIRALGWAPRWTVRDALKDVLADAVPTRSLTEPTGG